MNRLFKLFCLSALLIQPVVAQTSDKTWDVFPSSRISYSTSDDFLVRSAELARASAYLPLFATPISQTPARGIVVSSSFTYVGAVFDGTNDHLNRGADLTGIADGQIGLVSFWLKMGAGSGDTTSYRFFGNETERVQVYRHTDGQIVVLCRNSSDTTVAWFESNAGSNQIADGWVHVAASWDTGTAGRRQIYINGSSQVNENTFTAGSTIDFAGATDWRIGFELAGGSRLNGILCEFYFTTPASWFDLSNAGNLDNLRTAGGKPENLGADGSSVTGTQPLIYFHNAIPNWESNLGSGGGFTENGALTDSGADIP